MKRVVPAQRTEDGRVLLWQTQKPHATVISTEEAHREMAAKYARPALRLTPRRGPATNLRPAGAHRSKKDPSRQQVRQGLKKEDYESNHMA